MNQLESVHNYGQRYIQYKVTCAENIVEPFDLNRVHETIVWACSGYGKVVSEDLIFEEFIKNIFDGIAKQGIADALVLAASAFIERDPAYGYVAARLLFKKLYKQVTHASVRHSGKDRVYAQSFITSIKEGTAHAIFSEQLLDFDLHYLALNLVPDRDYLLDYMGIRTLYERYFMRDLKGNLWELPQSFWMRIAMGLALNEKDKNARAVEFYNLMSLLRYVPSTPTLLHAGLTHPQLSSCFLGTVNDDLRHIFKCIGDHAQLSKWSGGVAYDWSNIRATGAMVKSIKTESQGVVPFLKIANDTTAAINRSGKRRGASVVYLETWHLEIEDFLDLRRNTGDDRRRTHDISTAHWIPDLFMKRVQTDGQWTLFSPHEVSDLHHLYGKEFEKRYVEYEQKAQEGKFEQFKVISAKELWRKMMTRLFETGHPWLTFKDACNIRSPQDHVGVVHCSNLCTEITLNNSEDETAVCNLGSINLAQHVVDGVLDKQSLAQTVQTGMRMLDNVIDINFYPTVETKNANMRHRPVGLGLMGFQDMLYKYDLTFEDARTVALADEVMEFISYHAILTSSKLAQERGVYQSYKGSKWDRDIFPQDTLDLLEQERNVPIDIDRGGTLDWAPVRYQIKQYGMRNSNTMAIAPTATISNISGCFPCIEPIYKNLYVKANMSGEFTVVNKYLIEDLKKLGLWNQEMIDQLKYYDGSVQMIEIIPQKLKDKYKEAFEIDPLCLVQLTAVRGKWIDQSQSHNVFISGVSGKKLSDVYMAGWQLGLKTFYYLRSLGASQIEKS
ncbi:MAG: ribonucleoside-diphosphate reductase subunit alpha, partial [bacterium]|nr:ribonucleoside-diphosphate reductase subunit alpha [bacterium]